MAEFSLCLFVLNLYDLCYKCKNQIGVFQPSMVFSVITLWDMLNVAQVDAGYCNMNNILGEVRLMEHIVIVFWCNVQ